MTDLVRQLREMAGPIVPNVCTEAADEIERLQSQRVSAAEEFAATRAELAACRVAYEQAIRDRDAARLAYCRDVWQGVGDEDEQRQLTPREIAARQGWQWPIPDHANHSTSPNSSEVAR